MTRRARFWFSALGAAAALAGLTAAGVPLLLGLELRERFLVWLLRPREVWLLAVFSEGVLAVLLGAAALGGWMRRGRGARDALEAGASRRERSGAGGTAGPAGEGGMVGGEESDDARPALWVAAVGGCLLGIYFLAWLILGGGGGGG